MKNRHMITLAAGLVVLVGCGGPEEQGAAVEVPQVFVEQAIGEPSTPIPVARKQFQPGDKVTLTGLVMGVPSPFVEGRAVFVLGDDATLTPCDRMGEDDHCATPWDVCCDASELKANGIATIQLLDDNGKPAKVGLKGVRGLSELSRVTVSGTVAKNSTPEAFVVDATAIHIGVR